MSAVERRGVDYYLNAVRTGAVSPDAEVAPPDAEALRPAAEPQAPETSPLPDAEPEREEWDDEPPGGYDAPSKPDPSDFFGSNGLDLVHLTGTVLDAGPVARGIDGKLWHYSHGVWLPGGNEAVGRRVRDALGPRFRNAHLNNVTTWFEQDEATIGGGGHADYVNVVNGMLRWRTGDLEAHRPDLRSTVQLPVLWNPEATCPAVDSWLADVIPDDAGDFIDELLGYLVLNGNPLHVAVLLLGAGRNGKGTFLRLVSALLGHVNTSTVPLQTLAENRFAAADLFGKLANICGDLDARMMDRSDTFKMATGGDALYAEHKYGASFSFTPWCTMLFSANTAPPTKDTSDGYYARWLIVPFTANLTGRLRPQADLDAELQAPNELEGLFARAVRGLQRLMTRGQFDPPPSVRAAGEEFRRTTDPVASFAGECLNLTNPDLWLERKLIYDRYRTWCEDNGRRAAGTSTFYERLRNVATAATETKRQGRRGFLGIGKGSDW